MRLFFLFASLFVTMNTIHGKPSCLLESLPESFLALGTVEVLEKYESQKVDILDDEAKFFVCLKVSQVAFTGSVSSPDCVLRLGVANPHLRFIGPLNRPSGEEHAFVIQYKSDLSGETPKLLAFNPVPDEEYNKRVSDWKTEGKSKN